MLLGSNKRFLYLLLANGLKTSRESFREVLELQNLKSGIAIDPDVDSFVAAASIHRAHASSKPALKKALDYSVEALLAELVPVDAHDDRVA